MQYKFRGKRIDNGEWITGSYVSTDASEAFILIGVTGHIKRDDYECYMVSVIPKSVGMFIGLKDKNGKDIYEGDIITHHIRSKPFSEKAKLANVSCLVQWDDGFSDAENKSNPSSFNRQPGFAAYPIDRNAKGADWGRDWSEFHNCEIIGNTQDNPELLNPPADSPALDTMNNNFDPRDLQPSSEEAAATETQPAEGTSEATGAETTGEGALVD